MARRVVPEDREAWMANHVREIRFKRIRHPDTLGESFFLHTRKWIDDNPAECQQEPCTFCSKPTFCFCDNMNCVGKDKETGLLPRVCEDCHEDFGMMCKNCVVGGYGKDVQYCRVCWITKEKPEKLFKCSRCGTAYYCCKEHQAEDWKRIHRSVCNTLKKGCLDPKKLFGDIPIEGGLAAMINGEMVWNQK